MELKNHYIEIGYYKNYEYCIHLPNDFNPIIYKRLNINLININTDEELIKHYTNIGYFKKYPYKVIENLYKNTFSISKIQKNNNIKSYTIYGERCSGTNYLEELMNLNFDIKLEWNYGRKHFFGFNNLSNSDDTLFICIIRDIYTWLNSLFITPHHITHLNTIDKFLNSEIRSYDDVHLDLEILEDKHIYTNDYYKNIFELRYTKLKFLLDDLPSKIKNYIFIRYEDLNYDFENTMNKIKNTGIKIKDDNLFPINSFKYKKEEKKFIENKNYLISKNKIYKHSFFNLYYEKKINYIK